MAVAHIAGREYEPGRHIGIIHASHLGELAAEGWQVMDLYHDGTLDVLCGHLARIAAAG